MVAAFSDGPILTPYRALQPKQALGERNTRDAYRARDSEALKLDRVDEADEQTFNVILWHAIKGPHVPMPLPRTAFRAPPGRDDD